MVNRKDGITIKRIFRERLNHLNPSPEIRVRLGRSGKSFHVFVISDFFSGMSSVKRHDFVWDLVEEDLDEERMRQISMLGVLTPEETDGLLA
ncbi:BolA/IbaG family iron-sulfur metabolism protein [Candidatus Poribacteria bacterium]|nr:BolA/IbaG family iron-sulfur metabolism protein [Candidatus Poribacteria bacterium]